ncbi:hypothetical protein CBR_g32326 [Chara braunii]|uniref:Uncharacterized protein n=1 Tax=Chara braunii TaxID=69332 RepID=A0A388JNI6_CHABU|nr:hypothetical protein CBR_g32326 [Chara braunii]|eukprot:GBG59313.1 hypothetical protein CBR_g32326 [Chara braunii]
MKTTSTITDRSYDHVVSVPVDFKTFFRNEFRCSQFGLQGQHWERFVRPRWYRGSESRSDSLGQWVFLVLRLILAVYWSGWVVRSGLENGLGLDDDGPPLGAKWFIYLTHLSALFEAVYLIFAFLLCLLFTLHVYPSSSAAEGRGVAGGGGVVEAGRGGGGCQFLVGVPKSGLRPSGGDRRGSLEEAGGGFGGDVGNAYVDEDAMTLPWSFRLTWFLRNVEASWSFFVFALYWFLVYEGGEVDALNAHVHGVNFLIMLLDGAVAAMPMRILHFYQPVGAAAAYSGFAALYWAFGGRNEEGERYIYKSLNFADEPRQAVIQIVLICLVATPVFHLVFCLWNYMWYRWTRPSGRFTLIQRDGVGK